MVFKKRRLLIAIVIVVALGVIGCAEEDRGPASIEIMPTIRTRVSGTHFEPNDCIGLSVVRGSEPYVENRMMTYNGSAFTSPDLLWYNDLNVKSTLVAYCPYLSSGAPRSFSVAADQTGGCEGSDLLAAVRKEVTPAAAPVAMLFSHLLSQLTIVVTNSSEAEVTGVMIGGFVPTADVDLEALTVRAASGAAGDIKACEIAPNASYRAILVPQQAALTVTITTDDGKPRSKTIADAKLESGLRYDLAVVVTNVDIQLSLSGDIKDWGDGGSLGGGDSGDGDGDGDDGSLTYEHETYRTKLVGGKVWMIDNLRLQPAGIQLENGMWYPSAGAGAVPPLGMLYDYSTALAGGTYLPGSAVRGICPEGWHIPNLEELTAFSNAEDAAGFMVATGFWNPEAELSYGDASKSYLMGASSQEPGRCDALLYSSLASPPTQLTLKSTFSNYGLSVRCVKN